MKKIAILFIGLMLLSSVGCAGSALETYQEAVLKTEGLDQGKSSFSIGIQNVFRLEGLTQEEQLRYQSMENIEMNYLTSFDKSQNLRASDFYFFLGDYGLDGKLYQQGRDYYLKLPILSHYLKMDENTLQSPNKHPFDEEHPFITRVTQEWIELLEVDNVVKGERAIMLTEDGEVKVTRFTVEPSEDQVRLFMKKVFSLARAEKESLIQLMGLVDTEDFSIEEMIDSLETAFNSMDKVNFKVYAYIDIDGFIVRDETFIEFEQFNPEPGGMYKMTMTLTEENWENNRWQDIQLPEFNSDNVMSIEDMDGIQVPGLGQ